MHLRNTVQNKCCGHLSVVVKQQQLQFMTLIYRERSGENTDSFFTGQIHGQADEWFIAVRRPVAGVSQQTHPVRLRAIGGPHLPPVDHVLVPLPHSFGHDTCGKERTKRVAGRVRRGRFTGCERPVCWLPAWMDGWLGGRVRKESTYPQSLWNVTTTHLFPSRWRVSVYNGSQLPNRKQIGCIVRLGTFSTGKNDHWIDKNKANSISVNCCTAG